jgi:GLPGLI family protein
MTARATVFLSFGACLLALTASAQTPAPPKAAPANTSQGVVQYERRTFWPRIYARMTYLSQEQKDRITNLTRNFTENKEKMKLTFSESQSLYTHATESAEYEGTSYKGRNEDLFFYRDFDKESMVEVEETLGRTYVVEDSLRVPAWKIGDQIKEIAGHLCSKATTTDPLKNQTITAWFAQDIPVSAGPERFYGLPGLILELDINEGDVVIEAISVDFKPTASELKPPKSKGKRLNSAAFDKLIREHIATSMKAQQNPYWSIRY